MEIIWLDCEHFCDYGQRKRYRSIGQSSPRRIYWRDGQVCDRCPIWLIDSEKNPSKTELKKRQKQRAIEDKKKDKKDKAAADPPPKAGRGISAEEEESNLTPNVRLLHCYNNLLYKSHC